METDNDEKFYEGDDDIFEEEEFEDDGQASIVEVFTPVGIEVDTTHHFQVDKVFHNKEAVVDYARKCGRKHGIVVVVKRSDLNDPNRTPRILFGCERSGGYRGRDRDMKRKTSTKKCGCPFSMKAHVVDIKTGTWKLVVLNGKHNHALVRTFEGHSYIGRLSKEEKETVERLSKTGVKTRDILNHIKLKDPTNSSTLKTLYNARTAMRIHETEGKSHMQQLFKLCTDNGYVTRHRFEETTEVVKDLFWCNSTSIQLARAFPFVFMLDCTYKTNKYRLPLLQIVGVTSTMKTFSVAFCYMSAEKEENYVWALGCFRDLFDGVLANVFICDREIALMNALKLVFPAAKNMLCRVHISRNVLSNCVGLFRLKSEFDDFMAGWGKVMHASTEKEYEEAVNNMQSKFKDHPNALSYIHDSWLSKYKTLFVSAYVDQFFHLGNTSTNRVESSHAKLKKYLTNSVGGFVQSFNKIDLLLQGQVVDIKASFEDSLTRVPIRFRTTLFKELVNMVSTAALEKIESELASLGSNGVSEDQCNHICVKAFGLPCRHMLTQYKAEGRSIPLSDVHNFWKQLCIKPYSEDSKDELSIEGEIDIVRRLFAAATIHQKLEIKRQLQTIGKPSNTTLLEPKPKLNLRGRKKVQCRQKEGQKSTKRDPSSFEFAIQAHVFDDVGQSKVSQSQASQSQASQRQTHVPKPKPKLKVHRTRHANTKNWVALFPMFIQPYISNIFDVPGDGHCGFRVVASFFGWENDGWKVVRKDLANELHKYAKQYDTLMSPFCTTNELLASVECCTEMADRNNWMIMPYMGNVISTCYNVVVLLISHEQCLTFFPLRDPMPVEYKQGIMVFGYINDSHFVRMELAADSPMPPVSKMWYDHHHPIARNWPENFAARIDKFRALSSSNSCNIATVELID